MTVQEAIKYLRLATDEAEEGEFSDVYRDMCEMSIKALEKQVAKKPIAEGEFFKFQHCPSCETLINYGQKFCHGCGQALKWGEEDD